MSPSPYYVVRKQQPPFLGDGRLVNYMILLYIVLNLEFYIIFNYFC
jgi:hypothetical protein